VRLFEPPRCIPWLFLALGVIACGDPIEDAAVSALGPEPAGQSPGPFHRPGQPCVTCHGPSGAAKSAFAFAGTVYREKGKTQPLGDVDIVVTDATGRTVTTRSNCAGNFFVGPDQATLTPPWWVTMRHGTLTIDMESPVYREGSCATCHRDPAGPASAGAVYMTDEPEKAQQLPTTTCAR
jgi:mono/diheme cytochrome c family protein